MVRKNYNYFDYVDIFQLHRSQLHATVKYWGDVLRGAWCLCSRSIEMCTNIAILLRISGKAINKQLSQTIVMV